MRGYYVIRGRLASKQPHNLQLATIIQIALKYSESTQRVDRETVETSGTMSATEETPEMVETNEETSVTKEASEETPKLMGRFRKVSNAMYQYLPRLQT